MKSKETKQDEAAVRQAARDLRSPQEQLDKLDKLGFYAAAKERSRLERTKE